MTADAAARTVAGPPERIVLRGMVLRRWSEDDVDGSLRAVATSYDHLHAWMPWAARPPDRASQRGHMRTALARWRRGEAYGYGIFALDETTVLGGIGLHRRIGPGGLEIGYWVHAGHTRQGIASTAAAALTEVAFALPGTERVEIHCDQGNVASNGVPRRLGYHLDRTRERPKDVPAATGTEMIWVMPRASFADSEAARRAHAALPHPRRTR
jgi:RimJ/RimL family protein N-acetyltransferase